MFMRAAIEPSRRELARELDIQQHVAARQPLILDALLELGKTSGTCFLAAMPTIECG
jgi:hypothetical protein